MYLFFIYLSIYPSIHLSIYPSIHLSIYPSIYLSIYLDLSFNEQTFSYPPIFNNHEIKLSFKPLKTDFPYYVQKSIKTTVQVVLFDSHPNG